MEMSWTWVVATELSDPDLAEDLALGWPTREGAEAWLTSFYADLAEEGVREVTLMDDDTAVYTMGLDSMEMPEVG